MRVVHLVDVGIDYAPMQEAVRPIEHKVLAEHEEGDGKSQSNGSWQVFLGHRMWL